MHNILQQMQGCSSFGWIEVSDDFCLFHCHNLNWLFASCMHCYALTIDQMIAIYEETQTTRKKINHSGVHNTVAENESDLARWHQLGEEKEILMLQLCEKRKSAQLPA